MYFPLQKETLLCPAISVKSDNMLCSDFVYYRQILIVVEYRTIFIFVLIVIYLNSLYDYVVDVLKGLDVNKGSGPAAIPLRVLRECADKLASLQVLSTFFIPPPTRWAGDIVSSLSGRPTVRPSDRFRTICFLKVMTYEQFFYLFFSADIAETKCAVSGRDKPYKNSTRLNSTDLWPLLTLNRQSSPEWACVDHVYRPSVYSGPTG